jgi:hypothetical protein
MDVRLPDGTIIQNVPDGMSKADLVSKLRANGYDVSKLETPTAPAYDPTEGMSGGDKFLAGVGKGMTDVARGVGQLVGLVDQKSVDEAKARDAALMDTGAGMAGDIVGNLAVTAVPGAGAGAMATRGAAAVLPTALRAVAPTVGAAASGALVAGTTEPVASGESRLGHAGMGAAGGAIGDVATRGLARVAQPLRQSDAVKTLLKEGVVPTPGQAAGADSFIGKMEQRLQSIPLIGDLVTGGRNRATAEFNEAAINRAIPRGSQRIKGAGREAIEQAHNVLSQGYDQVLANIPKVTPTQSFVKSVSDALADPDLALTPQNQQRLRNIIQMQFKGRPGVDQATGEMSGQLAKSVDSTLGRLARDYMSSSVADDRALGMALRGVHGEWKNAIRQAAPNEQVAGQLDALNAAYANFVRVEKAAAALGAKDGVFTAAQLQNAVKASDKSVRKGAFARGDALMQDISEAGKSTLSQTVPNSGTADRVLNAMLLGGGASMVNPASLAALAAAPAVYSRAGSRYAIGDLPGQKFVSELMRALAPAASQVGRAVATHQ